MTLDASTLLGRYEIISLLGKGGMGEVYRAPDMKLKLEVVPHPARRCPARLFGTGSVQSC